jgi:hypothetical protein
MAWLLARHPIFFGAIATWVINYGVSAVVSAFDAPTKDSSRAYRFWFKVANNILAQNPSRANGVRIESSPNWRDALQAQARDQTIVAKVEPQPLTTKQEEK